MFLDFLRDPIWTFIGIIVAIALATGSIIYTQKQKSLKRITCQLISDAPVLTVKSAVKGRIQILFQNTRTVSDLEQLILKLQNIGNVAIKPEDYVEAIKFSFGKAEILDFEILETIPSNLGASLTQDAGTLILNKILLNSQDSIKLSVLVTGYTGSLEVAGRVVDVNSIKFESLEKTAVRRASRREGLRVASVVIPIIVALIAAVTAFIPLLFR